MLLNMDSTIGWTVVTRSLMPPIFRISVKTFILENHFLVSIQKFKCKSKGIAKERKLKYDQGISIGIINVWASTKHRYYQ